MLILVAFMHASWECKPLFTQENRQGLDIDLIILTRSFICLPFLTNVHKLLLVFTIVTLKCWRVQSTAWYWCRKTMWRKIYKYEWKLFGAQNVAEQKFENNLFLKQIYRKTMSRKVAIKNRLANIFKLVGCFWRINANLLQCENCNPKPPFNFGMVVELGQNSDSGVIWVTIPEVFAFLTFLWLKFEIYILFSKNTPQTKIEYVTNVQWLWQILVSLIGPY